MIVSNVPTIRARRILIALLTFALAAAFVLVASIAPADAAKDKKLYSLSPHSQEVEDSATFTFTNESGTNTQLVGSYSILFPAGFTGLDATVSSPAGTTWVVLSSPGDNPVIVSAASGGNRVGILPGSNEVEVVVTWAAGSPTGSQILTTAADQQAGGQFGGGNEFKPIDKGDEASDLHPEIVVCGATLCGAGFEAELLNCPLCTLTEGDPPDPGTGLKADLIVAGETGTFILVLTTTTGKAGPPGKAFVEVFGSVKFNDGDHLPDCGLKGADPVVNCVHINRVSGNNLEFTVIFDEDPNFKFR